MGRPRTEAEKYTSIFEKAIKKSEEFSEAFHIARKNSQGRIWVIGGFVYRPIIGVLYGDIPEHEIVDIDFLMENTNREKNVYAPSSWTLKVSENFGNNYLVSEDGKIRIDLNYLKSFHPIISRKLKPKLRHFFTTTPLDIQSIAYDLTDRNLGIRGRGIDAIRKRIIRVNNQAEAMFVAKEIMHMNLEEMVKTKAEQLRFGYNLKPVVADYKKTIAKLGEILEAEQKPSEKSLGTIIVPGTPKKEEVD